VGESASKSRAQPSSLDPETEGPLNREHRCDLAGTWVRVYHKLCGEWLGTVELRELV
jgi:hypothetical protein